jgi:hypothetical protein
MSQWIRIRSLHLTSGVTSRGNMVRTLCGRWAAADAPQFEVRPEGRTCETCLRIQVGH